MQIVKNDGDGLTTLYINADTVRSLSATGNKADGTDVHSIAGKLLSTVVIDEPTKSEARNAAKALNMLSLVLPKGTSVVIQG